MFLESEQLKPQRAEQPCELEALTREVERLLLKELALQKVLDKRLRHAEAYKAGCTVDEIHLRGNQSPSNTSGTAESDADIPARARKVGARLKNTTNKLKSRLQDCNSKRTGLIKIIDQQQLFYRSPLCENRPGGRLAEISPFSQEFVPMQNPGQHHPAVEPMPIAEVECHVYTHEKMFPLNMIRNHWGHTTGTLEYDTLDKTYMAAGPALAHWQNMRHSPEDVLTEPAHTQLEPDVMSSWHMWEPCQRSVQHAKPDIDVHARLLKMQQRHRRMKGRRSYSFESLDLLLEDLG